ncbi:hypothetical protein F5X98DRAFT_383761 [Xylaria grammica]|nr:hypothetical protein F5X98DRAFT_383761 [Xylaria grammica]
MDFRSLLGSIRAPKRASSRRGETWAWEIVALFLSCASLVALISLLARADGKPISEWTFFVSFNGLVSTLAAISRTSLGFALSSCIGQAKWNWFRSRKGSLIGFDRFDDASRGPWGALWLAVWLRARHWMVIGSVVTILLLAFEPFLQTVVSLRGRSFESAGNREVVIARSGFLNYSTCRTSRDNPVLETGLYQFDCSLDPGLQSAYFNGLSNSTSSLTPFAVCDTGNCTWPPFLSMDVCSSCGDITDKLEREEENDDPWTHEGSIAYKLGTLRLSNFANDIGTTPNANWAIRDVIDWNRGPLLKQHPNTLLYAFQIIQAAKTFEKGVTTWKETEVTASECALFFCVNLYHAKIRNGLLKEQLITSWSNRTDASYMPTTNTTREKKGPFDISYTHYLDYNIGLDYLRRDAEISIPKNSRIKYGISLDTKFKLPQKTIYTIGQVFNYDFATDYYFGSMAYNGFNDLTTTLGYLYHSRNISATVGNMAKAMSVYMRRAYGSTHAGVSQEWVICYEVQWGYMAAPIFTILLGISFCVACMLQTRRLGLELWKTDLIATLAHSTDKEIRDDLRNANVAGFLSAAARNIVVRFEDGMDGPELKKIV